jgi:hypothetical protein
MAVGMNSYKIKNIKQSNGIIQKHIKQPQRSKRKVF